MLGFEVSFKRTAESETLLVLQPCETEERAIELTRRQYPDCVIVQVVQV